MRGLNEPYPEVTIDGTAVEVGSARAHWTGDAISLTAGEEIDVSVSARLNLDGYRALVHAAWIAADSGANLDAAIGEITVVR